MKLNPRLPLSDRFQARIAAQAIVFHGFNMREVAAELRPGLKGYSGFGAKLLAEPAVQREITSIMNRTERNAAKFLNKMWDWLESGADDKSANELRCTAARILAKGYISEKSGDKPQTSKFHVEGIGEGMAALTGDDAPKVQ